MGTRNFLGVAALIFVLLASAQARGDNITVYANASGSSCLIVDSSPAVFTVFVLHTVANGATASFLSVNESPGFDATFVQEDIPFYHVGTFRAGVTVVYGECISSGSFLIGTITYQGHGTSQTCSALDTSTNPNSGFPPPYAWSEDCSSYDYPAPSTMPLYVNPSSECPPSCVVRSESSTWGRVKALYRR